MISFGRYAGGGEGGSGVSGATGVRRSMLGRLIEDEEAELGVDVGGDFLVLDGAAPRKAGVALPADVEDLDGRGFDAEAFGSLRHRRHGCRWVRSSSAFWPRWPRLFRASTSLRRCTTSQSLWAFEMSMSNGDVGRS